MNEDLTQDGLGLGAKTAPAQEEKYVSKPNTSLQMLNNKRVGDNVIQEKNTEVTLNSIRAQAKQELMQEIAKRQVMEQAARAREARAIDYGRGVGINEGLDLGLTKGYEYASRGYDPYASSDEDASYEDDYDVQDRMDAEGLGLR